MWCHFHHFPTWEHYQNRNAIREQCGVLEQGFYVEELVSMLNTDQSFVIA